MSAFGPFASKLAPTGVGDFAGMVGAVFAAKDER